MAVPPLSRLKDRLVTPGARPYRIRTGALKGLRMQLDLTRHTQVYLGLYEREVQRWLGVLGRDLATAVDVGAADGAYTLYFLLRTPARIVHAFEPDSTARNHLLSNVALNAAAGDERLCVSSLAVGSRPGPAATCLDALAAMAPPGLVKIDVEGGELEVLRGARRLLAARRWSWIVETHSMQLEDECIRLFTDAGLEVSVVNPAWWRIVVPEARPIAHNRWIVARGRTAR